MPAFWRLAGGGSADEVKGEGQTWIIVQTCPGKDYYLCFLQSYPYVSAPHTIVSARWHCSVRLSTRQRLAC